MPPGQPVAVAADESGPHTYTIAAAGPQGERTPVSEPVATGGYAILEWDSVAGAETYFVFRDDIQIAGPLRIEGSSKRWADPNYNNNRSGS